MQTLPLPQTRDLVLIGGGHAHALVLRDWAMNPLPGARLTLIDPNPVAPYTGMLPGLVAGHYPRAALEIDLVRLARHAGARLIAGRAEGLDPVGGTVRVAGRPPVAFDIASIDIGITSGLPELPGFADHGIAAKPLGDYAEAWERFLAAVAAGRARPEIAILGAGVGGVELALAMDHRLRTVSGRRITLIEAAPSALPHLGRAARRRLLGRLARAGIALRTGTAVTAIDAAGVRLESGEQLPAALVLGAAGSRPHRWLSGTGLHLTEGFVTVDESLRSVSHPAVFAAGDCAHMAHAPRPKAGVFAVRQAPVLAANLRAALGGGAPRGYRPQRDYLKLVSLGERAALADKWGLPLSGRWLWRIKDRIDRRFMRMFHDLPAMPGPALPPVAAQGLAEALGPRPLCGGCGAKVGPAPLRAALEALPSGAPGVILGAGDDAAVLAMGQERLVIATDHLRAFTLDPWLMARIATSHALGDIWAMGARPQAALLNVILPPLSETLQRRTLAEILDGAAQVLDAAGAEVVGGHSSTGAELTIGLTVIGTPGARILTKAGARPGDALVLTRPIGSGTLLAAEMARAAPPRAIAALWTELTRSQAMAAEVLAPVARAMTDVTGFGLAGHLDEMLRAGGVAASLTLAAVPLLEGAEELARAGHASSLAPANRAALAGRIEAPASARAALLFDPQTAGGLLAAVPPELTETTLARLSAAGYAAAMIGTIRTGDEQGTAILVT